MASTAGLVLRASLQNYTPAEICIKGSLNYTSIDLENYNLEKK